LDLAAWDLAAWDLAAWDLAAWDLAGVLYIEKFDAFNNATSVNIKTWNNALC